MLPLACALLCTALVQAPAGAVRDARGWLGEALEQYQQQQWERSRQAALKALELDPRLGDAEVLLGLVATMQSRFEEAEKRFRSATSLQPSNPRAWAYLGSTELQLKRIPEAARAFHLVLRLDPDNTSAHYNLGLIAMLEGKPAEALPRFEDVRRSDAKDVPALIGVLECQLLLKHGQDAARSAQQLQALVGPRDPRLLQAAAMLAIHGNYTTAIPILERVRQAVPDSREAAYNLALAYLRTAQFDRAAEAVRPLLEGPGGAEAHDLLGEIESGRGRHAEALSAYAKAAELEPRNEDYRFDAASETLRGQGAETGSAAFAAAVRDFPGSWRMRLGLGSAAYLEGKYEDATRALLEAVKLAPAEPETYNLLGHAYESAASLQPEIVRVFEAYLKTSPKDPWAYYHYGTILYLRSQSEGLNTFAQARQNLLKAIRLNPDFAEAHVQLGMIAETDEEAVRSLERAVALDPNLGSAHYRLGLAYQRLGNREKAKTEMDLFRKLRAANEAAERVRVLQSLAGQKK